MSLLLLQLSVVSAGKLVTSSDWMLFPLHFKDCNAVKYSIPCKLEIPFEGTARDVVEFTSLVLIKNFENCFFKKA